MIKYMTNELFSKAVNAKFIQITITRREKGETICFDPVKDLEYNGE
ncbi:hypothetical protein GKZ90_0006175 [Flavobacterium sp. MC2016-06]|jgi:hypothetical protein|nr:hypothetical protein [Flavobacterium sp. MC2016-06]MBU3857725.1 hypothetical protein [Flavobacterium sp. MC2016-06]